MAIKTIPFSRLEAELKKTLDECADTGEALVVEMPDRRMGRFEPSIRGKMIR